LELPVINFGFSSFILRNIHLHTREDLLRSFLCLHFRIWLD
jgi:hypothetical protein